MEGRDNTPSRISSTWPAKAMRKQQNQQNTTAPPPAPPQGPPARGVVFVVMFPHRVGRPCARNPLWR
eukprot:2987077-Heterocapsa_arctica.AAC.1